MAGITRKVHMVSNVEYGPIDKFAPDLGIRAGNGDNGEKPVIPKALCFSDPDGERHVYLFSEEGRQALLKQLTGGVIIPTAGGHG